MSNVFSRRDFLKASAAAVRPPLPPVSSPAVMGAAARSRPQPSGWVNLK